jgi:hypothetical protein
MLLLLLLRLCFIAGLLGKKISVGEVEGVGEMGVEVDEEEVSRGSVVIDVFVMVVGVRKGPEAVGDVGIDMIGSTAMWLEGSPCRR